MADIFTSFQSLTQDDFETHATDLLSKQRTSHRKKRVLTYLQTTNAMDHADIEADRASLRAKIKQNRLKESKIKEYLTDHAFDFTKHSELLSDEPLSSAELNVLLSEHDSEIFLNQNYTQNITVTGDDIVLSGIGNQGSARAEELTNSVTITGDIIVNNKNAVFRNINFNTVGGRAIVFTSGCEHVKFENCIFTAPAGHAGSQWFYGENFKGNCVLTNCIISGYTSWLLFDISSTSGEPQFPTNNVRIKKCLFKNNKGSGAIRGKTGQPTKLIQVVNNKFISTELHQYFWAFVEASGHVKRVEITGNVFEAPTGNETLVGSRHAVQVWSKNPMPWSLEYTGNKINNMKLGLCMAHSAGFYSPNTDDDAFLIDLSRTLTNVTYAASFGYKNVAGTTPAEETWLPGVAYFPDNSDTYPTAPPVVNPNGYGIVTGAV